MGKKVENVKRGDKVSQNTISDDAIETLQKTVETFIAFCVAELQNPVFKVNELASKQAHLERQKITVKVADTTRSFKIPSDKTKGNHFRNVGTVLASGPAIWELLDRYKSKKPQERSPEEQKMISGIGHALAFGLAMAQLNKRGKGIDNLLGEGATAKRKFAAQLKYVEAYEAIEKASSENPGAGIDLIKQKAAKALGLTKSGLNRRLEKGKNFGA
jgi:hypothetical protein